MLTAIAICTVVVLTSFTVMVVAATVGLLVTLWDAWKDRRR